MFEGAGHVSILLALAWLLVRLGTLLARPRAELEHLLGGGSRSGPCVLVTRLGSRECRVRWWYSGRRPPKRHQIRVWSTESGALISQLDVKPFEQTCWIRGLEPGMVYTIEVMAAASHTKDRFGSGKATIHTLLSPSENVQPEPNGGARDEEEETLDAKWAAEKRDLDAEIAELHRKRRTDESSRSTIRAELKTLESSKHALERQRAKIAAAERYTSSRREVHEMRQRALESHRQEVQARIVQEGRLRRRQIEALDATICEYNSTAADLGEEISRAQQELRALQETLSHIHAANDRMRSAGDSTVGFQTQKQSALLEELVAAVSSLSPVSGCELRTELEEHIAADLAWNLRQTALEQQYMESYQQFETATRSLELQVEQAQELARAQARIYAYEYGSQASLPSSLPPSSTSLGLAASGSPMGATPPIAPAVSASGVSMASLGSTSSLLESTPQQLGSAGSTHINPAVLGTPTPSRGVQSTLSGASPVTPSMGFRQHSLHSPSEPLVNPGSAPNSTLGSASVHATDDSLSQSVGNLLPSNLFMESDSFDAKPQYSPMPATASSSRFFSSNWHDRLAADHETPGVTNVSDAGKKSPRRRLGERLLSVRRLSLFARRGSRDASSSAADDG